jgi:hypothetical protein
MVPVLIGLAAACTMAPERPTGTATLPRVEATTAVATATSAAPRPTQAGPTPAPDETTTGTPIPRTVTPTSAPAAQLLECPEAGQEPLATEPLRLIYVNEDDVWLWDEASQARTRVRLPDEAMAPRVSANGRWVAYLIRGQAHDTPLTPVSAIPLWLFDRETGQAREVAAFETIETRARNSDSPGVVLQLDWLPGGPWLLVTVVPEAAGTGILHPTGDLYLVNAETQTYQRLLQGGQYEYLSLRPDGRQIAALDTSTWSEDGTAKWEALQDGALIQIDIPPGPEPRRLPIRLPNDAWAIQPPIYSPDGARLAVRVETGFTVVEMEDGAAREVAFENTCRQADGCNWTRILPVHWLPDSQTFVTWTTINDYFDERAETTVAQIHLGPEPMVEVVTTLRANAQTLDISPDGRYLTYWNQSDTDTLDAGQGRMNWVSFYVMDVQDGRPELYAEGSTLRLLSWNPDSHRFLYGFAGNPLMLGNICLPPRPLVLPPGVAPIPAKGHFHGEVQWHGTEHFLLRTLPADGTATRYSVGLYYYALDEGGKSLHVDDLVQDGGKPYGYQLQVIRLED